LNLGTLGSERVEIEGNFAFEVGLNLIKTAENTSEKQDPSPGVQRGSRI